MVEYEFVVRMKATEPPPDYGLHLLLNLRKEMNLRFGEETWVAPMEDSDTSMLLEQNLLDRAVKEVEDSLQGALIEAEMMRSAVVDRHLELMREYGI